MMHRPHILRLAPTLLAAALLTALSGISSGVESTALAAAKRGGDSNLPLRTARAQRGAGEAPRKAPGTPMVAGKVETAKSGPWGEIEYFTTYLQAPEHLLKTMVPQNSAPAWKFLENSPADVERFLSSLDVPASVRGALLDQSKWLIEEKTITISPSRQLIEELPPTTRATLYNTLARWSDNHDQFEPKRVIGGSVRTWLAGANLREEILSLIERLTFTRGSVVLFSDETTVLNAAESDAERLQIQKAISRTPTLVMKLRLHEGMDVEKLVEYWGGNRRRLKDIVPFLESMAATPGVDRVDVLHLLPPLVRRLLYTFPNPAQARSGYYPDCHWSALNFFNFEPFDRLADSQQAAQYTIENFDRVDDVHRYGDILFFTDAKTGNAYHSCVYVADDIVFTKNGRSPTAPWVLMKLDEVKELYAIASQSQIVAYRLKPE